MALGATESEKSCIVAHKGNTLAGIAGLGTEITRLDSHGGGCVEGMGMSKTRFERFETRESFLRSKGTSPEINLR